MFWLVIGYLFLFIVRPYEYWPVLGQYHIERVYMLMLITATFFWPKRRYIRHAITNAVLVFLFVMIVSSVFAFKTDAAYATTFNYFKLIVFYFIIVLNIQDEEELQKYIIAYILIMFLYIGKSSWEFFVHDRYIWRMGIKRMGGIDVTYGDPNSFAASINYSLPFLWAMIRFKWKNVLVRSGLWAYGVVALLCIIFTGSRGGMITAIVFMVLAAIGLSRRTIAFAVVALLLAGAWSFTPEEYQVRFKSAFIPGIAQTEGADASAVARLRLTGLKQGIVLLQQYPILGIGPGNFYYGWKDIEEGPGAHNLYGQLLGEIGLVGFICFFILIYRIVRTHLAIIKDAKSLKDRYEHAPFFLLLSTGCIQALILLLLNAFAGHNLYRYNWLWIGAIGVLSTGYIKQVDKSQAK